MAHEMTFEEFKDMLRDNVLDAFDDTTKELGVPELPDAKLPKLFKAIDEFAEFLYDQHVDFY